MQKLLLGEVSLELVSKEKGNERAREEEEEERVGDILNNARSYNCLAQEKIRDE
jgi:DNA-directed RNA polymerase alpha subunit